MIINTLGSFKIVGWKKYLAASLYLKSLRGFEWGVNDCMTLACDSIKAMTGLDPIANWLRGQYSNKYEAIKLVRGHFGLPFLETFTQLFEMIGFQETNKPELGDVAFIRIDNLDPEAAKLFDGITLATVFNDRGHAVCPGKNGLVFFETYDLVKAWKL